MWYILPAGCAMQLTDGAVTAGADVEVIHPIIELARQIND